MPDSRPILCFGELLWDCLPAGLFAGGAPFNVGYHLHQQGARVHIVSATGTDFLGGELDRRLRAWGLATGLIARHPMLPTGTVIATLGEAGDAHYEISPNVAWDQIPVTEEVANAAATARALVFGSLAQRSPANRAALDHLLTLLPARALRAFEVNLRAPFDDLARVRLLARQARVLTLNAAEAARLASGGSEAAGREEADARTLAAQTGAPLICITAGARGAGLLRNGTWTWEPGRPVAVADTIGAGDSFLAALLNGLLAPKPLPDAELLAAACRVGEWVATQRGATPAYDSSAPCGT